MILFSCFIAINPCNPFYKIFKYFIFICLLQYCLLHGCIVVVTASIQNLMISTSKYGTHVNASQTSVHIHNDIHKYSLCVMFTSEALLANKKSVTQKSSASEMFYAVPLISYNYQLTCVLQTDCVTLGLAI